eukprot:TRINITY_DN1718_c0_g1_i1.p1 TRINITY_DN1718_c0_g1~~TRINITY_DN1718_c0_g1_i1.p1  ORF type:complete len:281 (+),score=43.46 TRINITY_DN1718_c0_g1_i1:179-1021(+)
MARAPALLLCSALLTASLISVHATRPLGVLSLWHIGTKTLTFKFPFLSILKQSKGSVESVALQAETMALPPENLRVTSAAAVPMSNPSPEVPIVLAAPTPMTSASPAMAPDPPLIPFPSPSTAMPPDPPLIVPPTVAPSGVNCPPSPTQCSFHFQGYDSTIPEFSISATPDMPIGTPIVANYKGMQMESMVLNSESAEFMCPSNTDQAISSQFYTSNDAIAVRTFQTSPGIDYFVGQYVMVKIAAAQLNLPMGLTMNMNPGDGNTIIPEESRCVIFKTKM